MGIPGSWTYLCWQRQNFVRYVSRYVLDFIIILNCGIDFLIFETYHPLYSILIENWYTTQCVIVSPSYRPKAFEFKLLSTRLALSGRPLMRTISFIRQVFSVEWDNTSLLVIIRIYGTKGWSYCNLIEPEAFCNQNYTYYFIRHITLHQ